MNFVSAYLMIFLSPVLFALGRTARGMSRVGWYIATGLVTAAMLATYTRMSIVALFGGVVVALAVAGHLRLIVVAAVGGGLGLMMIPGLVQRFLDKNDRIRLYAAAWDATMESPWLGHGDVNYLEFIFELANRYHTMFGVAGSSPPQFHSLRFFRYGIGGAILTAMVMVVPILYFMVQARRSDGPAARVLPGRELLLS